MDRLTARNENGEAYFLHCVEKECYAGAGCADCSFIDIDVCEALCRHEERAERMQNETHEKTVHETVQKAHGNMERKEALKPSPEEKRLLKSLGF